MSEQRWNLARTPDGQITKVDRDGVFYSQPIRDAMVEVARLAAAEERAIALRILDEFVSEPHHGVVKIALDAFRARLSGAHWCPSGEDGEK